MAQNIVKCIARLTISYFVLTSYQPNFIWTSYPCDVV